MRITELIRISFRALTANKRRSLLTMLGIVIGITSVVTIMALGNGIKAATLKNLQTDQSGQQTAEITFLKVALPPLLVLRKMMWISPIKPLQTKSKK